MFRTDSGWYMLETVEGLSLYVLLCVWARACVRSLDSCVRNSVLEALHMWEWACVCGLWPAYMRCLVEPYSVHFNFFFKCFTSICNPNTSFCHFCIWTSLHPSFYLYSCLENTISHHFCLNQESNVIFFFCSYHLLMLVGETPISWWSGTTFSPLKLGPISRKQALSLSLAFF